MSKETAPKGDCELNIKEIVMREELMFREKIDESLVQQYTLRYKSGFYMDPVTVYKVEGQGYLLVDGFHRLTAARRGGCDRINVVLKQGTYENAKWEAANANLTHGKALSWKERKKVAGLYLKRYPDRSDRWIADDVGISSHTVKKIREQLESSEQIAHCHKLQSKDGRWQPRSKKSSSPSRQKSRDSKIQGEGSKEKMESGRAKANKFHENSTEKNKEHLSKREKKADKITQDRHGNAAGNTETRVSTGEHHPSSSEKKTQGKGNHQLAQTSEKKPQAGSLALSCPGNFPIELSAIDGRARVAKAAAHFINTIHTQEGWETEVWETTFQFGKIQFYTVIIKEEEEEESKIEDTKDDPDLQVDEFD